MEKFLQFSTGGGSTDPQNLDGVEFAVYKASNLISMRPGSVRTVDLIFKSDCGYDLITLGIIANQHGKVIRAISQAIATTTNANNIISVADVDGYRFIDKNIWSVSIKRQYLDTLKVTTTTPVQVPVNLPTMINSLTLTNLHATTSSRIRLYLTDKTGGDVTTTGVQVNYEGEYAVTNASQAIVVDTVEASSALFLNQRIYKSNGTFIGVCTAVGSTTGITFANGLIVALANEEVLYVGTNYYTIYDLDIPAGVSLVLESKDISFDINKYNLFMTASNSSIDVIVRY